MIRKNRDDLVMHWKGAIEGRKSALTITEQCSDDESKSSFNVSSGSKASINLMITLIAMKSYVNDTGDNPVKNVTPRDMRIDYQRIDYQTKLLYYYVTLKLLHSCLQLLIVKHLLHLLRTDFFPGVCGKTYFTQILG